MAAPRKHSAAMAAEEGLSVAQLAEQSGVKVPTIHYYRRIGLLPDATRVDEHRFRYGARHVQALRLIRLLRDRRHLSLQTISEVLPTLLAADQEAFRPEMWDEVVAAHSASPDDQARQRLVAAARDLFAERGFGAVSVEDLSSEAGLAKGSFYRLFEGKDDVYTAAVQSLPDVAAAALARRRVPATVGPERLVERLATALSPFFGLLLEASVRAIQGSMDRAVVANVYQRLRAVVIAWAAPAADASLAAWVLAQSVQRELLSRLGVREPARTAR